MRTHLVLIVALAGCPNDSPPDDAEVSLHWSFSSKVCGGGNVGAEVAEILDGDAVVAQRPAGACDPEPLDVPAGADTIRVAALNNNGTYCWSYDGELPDFLDGEAVLDIPSIEDDCAANFKCNDAIAAYNPMYQIGLELKGASLAFCDSQTVIEVQQILLSNEAATKGPAGNHLEGVRAIADQFLWTGAVHENSLFFGAYDDLFTSDLNLTFIGPRLHFRPAPDFAQLPAPVVPPPGEYFAFAQVLKGNVPHADPTNFYQYAFVFDSDGNPSNNYVPSPSYPSDFFKDTDRWYELLYNPTSGWKKKVSTAHGSSIAVVPTEAQIVVVGAVIFLLVPTSEFAVPNPSYRMTAFRHTGDYGLGPTHDFDGYVDPPVAMGLHSFTP
jgi:hypothetical protein